MVSKTKSNWASIPHEKQLEIFARLSIDRLAADYEVPGLPEEGFRQELVRWSKLWEPKNIGKFLTGGGPPKKDVFLGAWRDLDRAEALLELADNSIDEWRRRREEHPAHVAKKLKIHISIDSDLGLLYYKDNAGGVKKELLDHLVIPGFSSTTALTSTIGSYKTGGKKAVFRLATEARISTRYWSPAETSDDAYSIHLDRAWIENDQEYKYFYAPILDKSTIEKGETLYVLKLHEEPDPWHKRREPLDTIEQAIQRAYSLLFIRYPDIQIFFQNKETHIAYDPGLFAFSGGHDAAKGLDIRPQQVIFQTTLPYEGVQCPIEIEVILGSRMTTGAKEGNWGIDLYGNDRLFVAFDQDTFPKLVSAKMLGAMRYLSRGIVNVRGPNVFVPWDTHKRHLNQDREIVHFMKTNPQIRELFERWSTIYNQISDLPVKATVGSPLPKVVDDDEDDLFIPHRATVKLDPAKKRGAKLAADVFAPTLRPPKPEKDSKEIKISFALGEEEARTVSAHIGLEAPPTKSNLSEAIHDFILRSAGRKMPKTKSKTPKTKKR